MSDHEAPQVPLFSQINRERLERILERVARDVPGAESALEADGRRQMVTLAEQILAGFLGAIRSPDAAPVDVRVAGAYLQGIIEGMLAASRALLVTVAAIERTAAAADERTATGMLAVRASIATVGEALSLAAYYTDEALDALYEGRVTEVDRRDVPEA